jgi:hypothetical protein
MKKLLIGSLVIAAVSFGSVSAWAQDTLQRQGALARTPSFASLTASLAATPKATDLVIRRAVTAPDVRIINAITVIGSDNAKTINTAIEQHKEHIAALRDALSKNAIYTAALSRLAGPRARAAPDALAVPVRTRRGSQIVKLSHSIPLPLRPSPCGRSCGSSLRWRVWPRGRRFVDAA